MARSKPKNLLWNLGFLLIVLLVGVLSFQLFRKKEALSPPSRVENVKKGNGVLVVTMDKCPHCESMKKALEDLSNDKQIKGNFAWADSKDEKVADLGLSSYPSILIFKDGEHTEYADTDRSQKALLKLVKSTMIS